MVQFSPVPEEAGGEDHRVEGDVVLADELEELHVLRAPSTSSSSRGRVLRGDGDVADGRVEPDVEDLVLEALLGHGDAPLQVAGDCALLEAVADPGLGHLDRVVRPEALLRGRLHPVASLGRMAGRSMNRCVVSRITGPGAADAAPGLLELGGVEQLAAVLALVAARIRVAAVGAGAPDVAVGQEPLVLLAVELLRTCCVM